MVRKVDLQERVKKKLPKGEDTPFDKSGTNKRVLGILGALGAEAPVLPDVEEPEPPTYLSPSETERRNRKRRQAGDLPVV